MLKSITMLTANYSSNPFVKGLKPRKFLSNFSETVKKAQFVRDGRKFNPDWRNKAA